MSNEVSSITGSRSKDLVWAFERTTISTPCAGALEIAVCVSSWLQRRCVCFIPTLPALPSLDSQILQICIQSTRDMAGKCNAFYFSVAFLSITKTKDGWNVYKYPSQHLSPLNDTAMSTKIHWTRPSQVQARPSTYSLLSQLSTLQSTSFCFIHNVSSGVRRTGIGVFISSY